jgi:hypothetical protein
MFHANQNLDGALLWKDGKLCFGCNLDFSLFFTSVVNEERGEEEFGAFKFRRCKFTVNHAL